MKRNPQSVSYLTTFAVKKWKMKRGRTECEWLGDTRWGAYCCQSHDNRAFVGEWGIHEQVRIERRRVYLTTRSSGCPSGKFVYGLLPRSSTEHLKWVTGGHSSKKGPTIPRRRRGQAGGLESNAWRSVRPAFVAHITCCNSRNLPMNPGSL
jgi:hypothetical protein